MKAHGMTLEHNLLYLRETFVKHIEGNQRDFVIEGLSDAMAETCLS